MPQINLTNVIPIKLLSHSSIETLHSCPRKFEIYRMNYAPKEKGTIDTAFGHAVGVGVQELLISKSANETSQPVTTNTYLLSEYQNAIWKMFLSWEVDIDEVKPKSKKSFHTACLAVEKYQQQLLPLLTSEWELAYFEGKPAVELGFIIKLPNDYYYRGYVDAVLVNKKEKRFRVLELKTTGLNVVDVAQYKNSFQGVGYGVILDKLAASLDYSADYYVDYLVYKTVSQEFLTFPFLKTNYQRAKWLSQLLVETETIDLYLEKELFPTHGESCYNFYRQCQYFGICERENSELQVKKVTNLPTDEEFATAWSIDNLLAINSPTDSKNNSLDTQTAVVYNEPAVKEVIEEFDFVITFEELVSRQYENLASIQQEVTGNFEIDM